jgi:Holliday junction resolvase
MAAFEGVVSLFERNGAVEIRRVSSGGYAASEVSDLVSDLLETKKPVSKWSLWIDGIEVKAAETYSPTIMAKLFKGNTVELIAVKRRGRNGQFMAPVLKITAPGAVKAAPNKARLGR